MPYLWAQVAFGPYGCGYAYYGHYFDHGEPIEENWSNRLNSADFSGLTHYESQYKPLTHRYSVGELNFIYVKCKCSIKSKLEWTPKTIQNYC
jgi:hypothetical protein